MITLLLVDVRKKFIVGSIVVMVLLVLAGLNPAWAGSINPLDGKGLPIPGDLGMDVNSTAIVDHGSNHILPHPGVYWRRTSRSVQTI